MTRLLPKYITIKVYICISEIFNFGYCVVVNNKSKEVHFLKKMVYVSCHFDVKDEKRR